MCYILTMENNYTSKEIEEYRQMKEENTSHLLDIDNVGSKMVKDEEMSLLAILRDFFKKATS